MGKVWYYDDPQAHYDDPQVTYATASDLLPSTTMANKPVSYPVTEVLGFCDGISALHTNHKTAMIALGVDPTANLPRIGTKRDTLNTQNTEQEVMKTALRDKTPLVDAAKSDAYHEASQGADMLIAAFGNSS